MYKEYKSEIINPCKYPPLDFRKYKISMLIHSLGFSGLNVRSLPIGICLFLLFLPSVHTMHFLKIFFTAVFANRWKYNEQNSLCVCVWDGWLKCLCTYITTANSIELGMYTPKYCVVSAFLPCTQHTNPLFRTKLLKPFLFSINCSLTSIIFPSLLCK